MKKLLSVFISLIFISLNTFCAQAAQTSAATRLSLFKNEIVQYYEKIDAKKVLVIGYKDFLRSFREAVNKNPKYTYAVPSSHLNLNNYDFIIDAVNDETSFSTKYAGYPAQRISSFISLYIETLYDKTLEFFKKNDIKFYFLEYSFKMINCLDDYEKAVVAGQISPTSEEHIQKLYYDNPESGQFMREGALYGKYDITNNGKYCVPVDRTGKYCNVINGKRITTNTPSKVKNSVHIFGLCQAFCPAVSDAYTVESYLQRILNSEIPNNSISVENCGVPGTPTINDFEYMINEKYHPGDVVIDYSLAFSRQDLLKKAMNKHGFSYLIPRTLFDKPNNYGYVIADGGEHKNHRACEVTAKYIFSVIKDDFKNISDSTYVKYNSNYDKDAFLRDNPDLKDYLDSLKKYNDSNVSNKKIGSIVMNCNPFTLGHRYLIEKASSMVDKLYIFVVEEDKSIFPFKDRIELVKKGTEDLKNVTVLPSSKYMISLLTLPGYFEKDSKTVDTIDASKDLNLFSQYIAPTLGINVRFAGTEPLDKFTCEYNKSMQKELPKFNIEFREIERKTVDNNVISASKVRQLLKEQKFDELKRYVPETTYEYLMKNYNKHF